MDQPVRPDLLLSFYGDDLTGSTDAMEALSLGGVPTILFLDEPGPADLAGLLGRLGDSLGPVRAIGLAGTSRSQTPAWMDAHLAPAFAWLRGFGAELCHYKVCSTFDSSPEIGSIGHAIDLGAEAFGQGCVPLLVGAPQLRRYTAFGTLFAAYAGETYRIDRHPVMSRHPVTPMAEADLRVHLSRQTDRAVALLDLPTLALPEAGRQARLDALKAERPGVLMLDVADTATQAAAGAALWSLRGEGGLFVAGSSGVEYALLAEWARLGLVPGRAAFEPPGAVERLAVVSGSVSPTTERQIRTAEQEGFEAVPVDARRLAAGDEAMVAGAVRQGLAVLGEGRSVILHTALGPASDLGAELDGGRHAVGRGLGRILRALVEGAGLTRAVVAGGDTSSHALRELDMLALTTRLPLPRTPGSPLCTGHSPHPALDGLEVALKGGQVGADGYFGQIRAGTC